MVLVGGLAVANNLLTKGHLKAKEALSSVLQAWMIKRARWAYRYSAVKDCWFPPCLQDLWWHGFRLSIHYKDAWRYSTFGSSLFHNLLYANNG